MPFSNPIVGGTTLIRPAIQSPNYGPGSSGWSINKDGSAEFNDITVRGTGTTEAIVVGADGQPQVIIGSNANIGAISFPTNSSVENLIAGIISQRLNAGLANEALLLHILSPTVDGAGDRSSLQLNSQNNDGSSQANASLRAGTGVFVLDETVATFSVPSVVTTGSVTVGDSVTADNMRWGTAQTPAPGGAPAQTTVNVNFANAMPNTPRVVLTPDSSAADLNVANIRWATTGESTTGFTINCWRDTNFATNFNWIAISD